MTHQKPDILVIGSSNTDMVIRTDHFPAPGETIIGGEFFMNAGGKGANQAVAAARLGGKVAFITKVGMDIFGQRTIENLKNEGIDISCLLTDSVHPSGVAQIIVDRNAENSIVVAPGSNMELSVGDIQKNIHLLSSAEWLLMQLEIPVESIRFAAMKASQAGRKVILNPAPATDLPAELYPCLYLITPNESEAEYITGIRIDGEAAASEAAANLKARGVMNVIITLGEAGAYVSAGELNRIIPAPAVHAVDTTAAGDTFNGALVAALSRSMDIGSAISFANQAAALSVTKPGAQSSIPDMQAIKEYFT